MQIESGLSHTTKLHQAYFGKAPEAFYTVDMVATDGEFVLTMLDTIVLWVTQVDDAVVDSKPVGIDG